MVGFPSQGGPLPPPPPPPPPRVCQSLTPFPCPKQPWSVGWNSGVLASFCPHYHHHPVAPVSVGLLAPPTPLVGFSSLSDGAGCYGNCICLQDPQIAEPINPFPSHPPPDPAAIASKQPQRPAPPPPPSSPWVSLPLLSHQVSSPLSSFPPLPAPAFPFVCCSLWFVSHCGLASHLAFENLHFSFLHPDRLALERSPLPRSLSAILVVRLPGSLPHHRTINQPFSSLFGAFSSPPPSLPSLLLCPSSAPSHSQPISPWPTQLCWHFQHTPP